MITAINHVCGRIRRSVKDDTFQREGGVEGMCVCNDFI